MKHGRRIAIALGVCALAGAKAGCCAGTVEALVAAALERSPEIRAARTGSAAAGGQVTQAGLRPNPTLSASQLQMSGAQHETLVGSHGRSTSHAAPRQGRGRAVRSRGDRALDRGSRASARVARAPGAGQLLAARRVVEVMSEALNTARRMRELLDSKVNEGDIRKLDANIAAVEVGRMEADLTLAQADADAIAVELRALVGSGAMLPCCCASRWRRWRESCRNLRRPPRHPRRLRLRLCLCLPTRNRGRHPRRCSRCAPTFGRPRRGWCSPMPASRKLAARAAGHGAVRRYGHEFFGFPSVDSTNTGC